MNLQLPLGLILARDPREIFETWVFSFSPKSSIFFQISIEVTFWLFNLENYALILEKPS